MNSSRLHSNKTHTLKQKNDRYWPGLYTPGPFYSAKDMEWTQKLSELSEDMRKEGLCLIDAMMRKTKNMEIDFDDNYNETYVKSFIILIHTNTHTHTSQIDTVYTARKIFPVRKDLGKYLRFPTRTERKIQKLNVSHPKHWNFSDVFLESVDQPVFPCFGLVRKFYFIVVRAIVV